MKIVLAGKNDAAVEALEYLLERGDNVLVVGVQGDDRQDGWQRSLCKFAESKGVPVEQPRRINDPEFIQRLAEFGADVLVSIQYDQILRDPLFEGVPHPCLNLHFSLLPRNRGVAPIAWAILNGDPETGVTLHHMIEGIDAGDVIEQKPVKIEKETTARELYDRLTEAAIELFRSAHPFDADFLARRITQDESKASYHRGGDFDFSKRSPDWSRSAQELQQWFRSMIFPPFQYPELKHASGTYAVRKVGGKIGRGRDAAAGTILDLDPAAGTVEVAATGGSLHLRHLALVEAEGRFSEVPDGSFQTGDRLE